jgi:thiol-disulfide isomerase/thioredoxin
VLEIDVPRPASLEARFDPAANRADDLPFKGVTFQVLRQIQGDSYLEVATDNTSSIRPELRLTDLAPGNYLVSVGTQPKAEIKPAPGTEINPGAYRDRRKVVLRAGQSERVSFRYTPYDPNAFRGQRTAVVRVRMPDGTPAGARKMTVEYFDGHFGSLAIFSGVLPASGVVTLEGLTDRAPSAWPTERAYVVKVDDKQLGSFGFTRAEPTQEFEFQVAPAAGEMAPEVELVRLATGKPVRVISLRGKVVCLEFWATWCGPCQPAMAKLNELSRSRGASWKDRVALIPVSIDAAVTRVRPHALRRGWSSLEQYGAGQGTEAGFDAPAARAFGVFGVPEAILIGPDGRILWRGHPLDKSGGKDLQSRIEDALKK